MIITKDLDMSTIEIHKMLRNNIMFAAGDKFIKSVLITSTKNGEGKSTIASNLAITMANSGKKTLLVDFNITNPTLHKIFNLEQAEQALSIFKNTKNHSEFICQKNIENLYIITYQGLNKGNLSEIELCNKLKELLNADNSQYDFIIIDAPAVTEASYVQIISQYVDGCIFVIGSGLSELNEVKRAKELLQMAKANIIGAILNNANDNDANSINTVNKEYEDKQNKEYFNIPRKRVLATFSKLFNIGLITKKKKISTIALILAALLALIPILNSKVFNATASELNTNAENFIDDDDVEIKISETEIDCETPLITNSNIKATTSSAINTTTESSIQSRSIFNNYTSYPKNFPIQLTVNKHYNFYVTGNLFSKYDLKVIGDNNYEFKFERHQSWWNFESHWHWTPPTSGIFWLVVYDTDTSKVIGENRKVYINSQNDEYLQFKNLNVTRNNNYINISAKLKNTKPGFEKFWCKDSELEDKNIKFNLNIGESYIWSKTLLNEKSENIKLSDIKSDYDLKSDQNNKILGDGNYLITASLKSENSIEFEDAIAKSYKKNKSEGLNLSLKHDKGIKALAINESIMFTASINNSSKDSNLEYAFLIYDEKGKRLVKDYSEDKTFEWTPVKPGKYIICARVKHENKTSEYLPNSYEEEVAYPINIGNISANVIKINKVTVDCCLSDLEKIKKIKSHELHELNIHATNGKYNPNLMYKAYALHDGISETLCDYSASNIIPFYPKSYGDYKLVICVKDSTSVSDDVQKFYDVKVVK